MDDVIYYQRLSGGFFLFSVALVIILVGGGMNVFVLEENGGKMPVRSDVSPDDNLHFNYYYRLEVKHWYLTDIFKIRNYYFSTGDIVMVGGFLMLTVISIYISLLVRRKKCEKNKAKFHYI